ncbi:hypothetical protein ACEPAG_2553 [Sanghuangporus baumii]
MTPSHSATPPPSLEEKEKDNEIVLIEETVVVPNSISVDAYSDQDAEFGGPKERKRLERKLVRKLDWRMSILIIIYILNYIDRNNAAAARLRGFESDLHLKGQEYNTVLSIMYVGYILMQVPSNMFLNFIGRPSIYLPVCMSIWGVISICTGEQRHSCKGRQPLLTSNGSFVGAMLARSFLGVTEAAFFPGALFLLSKWYTRKELGLRMSVLVSSNLVSNAIGSLMASGILDGMEGKLGQAAWRWLFFIEGSITIVVAIVTIFILPDFPSNTRWLTSLERSLALRRMAEDGGINVEDWEEVQVGDPHNPNAQRSTSSSTFQIPDLKKTNHLKQQNKGLMLAMTDWRVWWIGTALVAEVGALSFNQFFPTLVATLGFGRTLTLVLVAPPWLLAATSAFFNARHSDKQGERFFHIVRPLLFGIVGFVIGMSTMNVVARYISMCMICLSYCGYMIMFSWLSNNIPRPPAKRAVSLAFVNGFSQLGNLAGSYCFPTNWGPTYRKSYGICIALQGLTIIMCCVFRSHLKKQNELLERNERERGEKAKGFRYIL